MPSLDSDTQKLLFSDVRSFSNIIDNARFFEVRVKSIIKYSILSKVEIM